MGWLCSARETAQVTHSAETMVRSDGASRRALCLAPDYEDNPLYRHILQPLGTRWSMSAPLFDGRGHARGLLYLHRSAEHGAFNDAEQRLLWRARDVLTPLGRSRPTCSANEAPLPHITLQRASLVVDARGRFLGMGDGAREMLYRSAAPGPGATDWLAPDVAALPAPVQDMALSALHALRHGHGVALPQPIRVRGQAGDYEFRLEPLSAGTGGDDAGAVLHLRHLEPADITLARELIHWKLSPQEKRVLIRSLRNPDQYRLTEDLGISLNTLKSYSKGMLRRHGFGSRQQMASAVLRRFTAPDNGRLVC